MTQQNNLINVRIGDYVYFEQSTTNPYIIRKIEELNKTSSGSIEARCVCLYRRRELSQSLIVLADRHQSWLEDEDDEGSDRENLSPDQVTELKTREVFPSRVVETLPATGIRGKCSVTLLSEVESLQTYLQRDDAFFYTLVYDPTQKSLQQDKGDIRVGSRYQVEHIPKCITDTYDADSADYEDLSWDPENDLAKNQIKNFITVTKATGLLARAADPAIVVRQPSLLANTLASCRDGVLQFAMDALAASNYDVGTALEAIVTENGPVLVRDQLEEWSPAEAHVFAESLEANGKDFFAMRHDKLQWKTVDAIVEYYYMFKTTERYNGHRKLKAIANETKPKKLVIPTHNPSKPNPALLTAERMNGMTPKPCDSCAGVESPQWYSYGGSGRLCGDCWQAWKRYGSLKSPATGDAGQSGRADPSQRAQRAALNISCTVAPCDKVDSPAALATNGVLRSQHHLHHHLKSSHGLLMSPSGNLVVRTRQAFYMTSTSFGRAARRLAGDALHLRRIALHPNTVFDKHEDVAEVCTERLRERDFVYKTKFYRAYHALSTVLAALPDVASQAEEVADWLSKPDPPTEPEHIAYPKPAFINYPVKSYEEERKSQMPIVRKRGYHLMNGAASRSPLSQPPPTKQSMQSGGVRSGPLKLGQGRTMLNGHELNPEDMLFIANTVVKNVRKTMTPRHFKKASRRPFRTISFPGALPNGIPNGTATPPIVNGSATPAIVPNGTTH